MDRVEEVRKVMDNILMQESDLNERHYGFVHLYGVSSICSLLALKRGLNAELCTIAGILHDVSSYKNGYTTDHAKLGSIEARKILNETKCFNDEEMDIICKSIYRHSDKQNIDTAYDEILKDADLLQHYLFNANFQTDVNENVRLSNLFKELEINL